MKNVFGALAAGFVIQALLWLRSEEASPRSGTSRCSRALK
jgi:hypothetical protein